MLILDFDGTITDVWYRFYRVFQDYWNIQGLTFDQYKTCKKVLTDDKNLLVHLTREPERLGSYEVYREFKRESLEKQDYLAYDVLILDSTLLEKISDYIVLTYRRSEKNYLSQLKNLGLYDLFFDRSVILDPEKQITKKEWLLKNISLKEFDMGRVGIIGDSEADLEAGLSIGAEVFLVKTGLREAERLLEGVSKSDGVTIVRNVNGFLQTWS
ncbi:hypothetical protein V511_10175 [Mesotoga sp. Brook.08.YT.4.2.5.1]|uniref:HAD family hydrolase n=1 Tax=unclassified Mesotoga TaxID=1184398 RepID=UPI000C99F5B5|nr:MULTISPECIES: HAD hydrolase-like protein [unclassified Mesotoga]PNE20170.1 hypothetical protein V511_10175 [Mesotoga sp. Brook.08.YT.4.2.5.1]PNS40782.1 hypothetical protein RJ60_06140 [Mesotoga sp. B105.6.4]RAO96720.1 hypothetical protein M388_13160 [Mesotoga sp. Brook.08.YT.4.2.5.4.]RDI93307.1 hypothetical protein Q502_06485 [Mesotoga sp. Brook.08.YT.4.2.5.2.]